MFQFTFSAMGTELEILVYDSVSKILQEKIKSEIFNYTVFFDEQFSRFKNDSLISKISQAPGIYSVPRELIEILSIYQRFFILTSGSLNPLVGNTLSDLGYDKDYSLRRKSEVRTTPNFIETVKILDNNEIEVEKMF